MSDDTFPPFIPAKPKTIQPGGLTKVDTPMLVEGVAESTFKPPRKRKAVEPKSNGGEKRKRRKPRPTSIPLDAVTSFAGLKPDEAEQVVMFCEALQTHSKAARKRIAEAIGKIFA